MDKYAIFLDIDGTLVAESDFPFGGFVSEANIRAIEKAQAAGHYVFLNTGRAPAWIQDFVFEAVKPDGIISGIGTHISINGKTIYENMINKEALKQEYRAFAGSKYSFLMTGPETVYVFNTDEFMLNPKFVFIDNEKDFEEKCLNDKIQKLEVFDTSLINGPHTIDEFLNDAQLASFNDNLNTYMHTWYVEGCAHGSSKSLGMLKAAEYLNIPPERTIAMGDSPNDADMLEKAGIGVAMGNAADEIKALADFVSRDCKEDGVAYAIEKLIFGKSV